MLAILSSIRSEIGLPRAARDARAQDRRGLSPSDPGIDVSVRACLAWLCRAQDCSVSADWGVARDFSLLRGWATSYPETTGYIVPTLLERAAATNDADLRRRAFRMLDWLCSIQFPNGAFQGGRIDSVPKVPVTFNTGQILLGLAAGVRADKRYREAMISAADWLRDTQDPDGCWRSHPTPFAAPGEKAYETHVAWGLLEAARLEPNRGYQEAALRNNDWALGHQRDNGWFDRCCLSDPAMPLTHTIGYVLRGIVEAYLYARKDAHLRAACLTADRLCDATAADGRLAGCLTASWQPAVDWVCLTGSVQIAHSLLLLYKERGTPKYLDTGRALNRFVRRTLRLDAEADQAGGVQGSFPIDGDYGRYQFVNWAAKFFIDSNVIEASLPRGETT